MIRFFALMAMLCFVSTDAVSAKSVYRDFEEAFRDRDNAYAAEFVERLREANEAVIEFRSAQADQITESEFVRLYKLAMDKVHEASFARGQGLTIVEFREFFEDRPSAARAEVWMQERLASIQAKERELDKLYRDFKSLPQGAPTSEIITATQAWIEAHGQLSGEVEELLLLDANLRSYFTARGAERGRRNSLFASLLGGLANGLREQRSAPQSPLLQLPTTIRCNEYFSGTVCRVN